jgi:anti-sigma B factor antagonist
VGLSVSAGETSGHYRLEGYLDLSTTPTLVDAVSSLNGDGRDLVLDCTGLSFVDSQGIRAFIAIAQAMPGGELRLTELRSEIARVLRLVGLDTFQNIELSEAGLTRGAG